MQDKFINLDPEHRLAIFATNEEVTLTRDSLAVIRLDVLSVMRANRKLLRAIKHMSPWVDELGNLVGEGMRGDKKFGIDMHLEIEDIWLQISGRLIEVENGLDADRAADQLVMRKKEAVRSARAQKNQCAIARGAKAMAAARRLTKYSATPKDNEDAYLNQKATP